jgi:CoA-transferase family III
MSGDAPDCLADLCGWSDEPGDPVPLSFAKRMALVDQRIRVGLRAMGRDVHVDAVDEITIRARLNGWSRDGVRSVGGSCHLLETDDGWAAVNLARDDDHEVFAALLGISTRAGRIKVSDAARSLALLDAPHFDALFADTGLPVARLGETVLEESDVHDPIRREVVVGSIRDDAHDCERPLVVDLSSLWAGPLCSRILQLAGFDVMKVESTARPDGARRGNPGFYAHLNAGKDEMSFDFTSQHDVAGLKSLIASADVVIEGSRPRALEQLGIVAADVLRDSRPSIWLSITGHGRGDEHRNRVGFGDDCAVAGGLVTRGPRGVAFFGDAVADPITGLLGAAAVLETWVNPSRSPVILDAALARSAAWAALPST